MANLQILYHQIESLSMPELEALKRFIEMRQDRLLADQLMRDRDNRAAIDALVSRIQQGSPSPELKAIYQQLQGPAVDPEDLKMFDWINNLDDDEVAGASG